MALWWWLSFSDITWVLLCIRLERDAVSAFILWPTLLLSLRDALNTVIGISQITQVFLFKVFHLIEQNSHNKIQLLLCRSLFQKDIACKTASNYKMNKISMLCYKLHTTDVAKTLETIPTNRLIIWVIYVEKLASSSFSLINRTLIRMLINTSTTSIQSTFCGLIYTILLTFSGREW